VRLLLFVVSAGMMVHAATRQAWPWVLLYGGAAALLVFGGVRYGSVRAAFVALRRGDLARAKKMIDESDPARLDRQSLAYYRWVEAALSEARGDLPKARDFLVRAVDDGLRTKDDRVIALCSLAAIHSRLDERAEAEARLAQAQSLGTGARAAAVIARARDEVGL